MKLLLIGVAALALSAAGSAQAQVAYTNAVLNGCYGHISTSVDDGSGQAKDVVGTLCFDGNGNILGTTGTPGLSGHVQNTDGKVKTGADETGTYAVTNTPGDGMGTMTAACGTHEFVISHVNTNGIAQGIHFIAISSNGKCGSGTQVIGGSAEYIGPLN
ncbi:MAG: hypothetical protein ABSD74_19225 [Rhizomicrobium sp.]